MDFAALYPSCDFCVHLGAISNLQYLAQMFDADAQLLQPRQIVEKASTTFLCQSGNTALIRSTPEQEVVRIDAVDESKVAGVPNLVVDRKLAQRERSAKTPATFRKSRNP